MEYDSMETVYRPYILKLAVITGLVFTAISCFTAWGEWGARANAGLIAGFGRWRVLLAVLLSWLICILANRQPKLIAWLYTASLFIFTGAALNQLQGGGYGFVLGGLAEIIVRYMGAGWLYLMTAFIIVIPFVRKRGIIRKYLSVYAGRPKAREIRITVPEPRGYAPRFADAAVNPQPESPPAERQPLQSVLDAYGVDASVVGVRNGHTTEQYIIRLAPGTRIRAIECLASEIAMALNTPVNTISFTTEDGSVILAVNKQEKQVADFATLASDKTFLNDGELIPVGITQAGAPLYTSLNTDEPHLLIGGTTRSGKTTFLQALIVALAVKNSPGELQFVLVAGSSDGFAPFAALPHLACGILYECGEIERALNNVIAEMDRRKQARRTDMNARFSKLAVVIDEIDCVIRMSDKGVYGEIARLVTRLAKESGKYNISLIVGAQEPSGDVIPSGALKCMNRRVCMQVSNARYSKQIIDIPDGAKLGGRGDLIFARNGAFTRCQGYFISPANIREIVTRLPGRQKPLHPNKQAAALTAAPKPGNVVAMNDYRHRGELQASSAHIIQKPCSQGDILRMYESGLSIREISARIGKGRHYVHDRIVKARELSRNLL